MKVFSLFQQFSREADTILIDTASGISSDVQFFSSFANQVLLIATPEPTAITDAYATMKVLARKTGERNFQLMINLVESESQGGEIYQTLRSAAERTLMGLRLLLSTTNRTTNALSTTTQLMRLRVSLTGGGAAGPFPLPPPAPSGSCSGFWPWFLSLFRLLAMRSDARGTWRSICRGHNGRYVILEVRILRFDIPRIGRIPCFLEPAGG